MFMVPGYTKLQFFCLARKLTQKNYLRKMLIFQRETKTFSSCKPILKG